MAFGIGIVGAGMAAAPHFLALRALVPDVVVRGVLTRNPVRAASVEAAGFAVVSNLADLLNNPGVDALLVLTPPDARRAGRCCCRQASAAGKTAGARRRGSLARDGGGVLLTQAIHLLDLMIWLAGPVETVQAMAAPTRHRMETEDFAAAAVQFACGALGAVMATSASYPGGGESLILNCANGTAALQQGKLTLRWCDGRVEQAGIEAASGGGAGAMAFSHHWHNALIADFVAKVGAGQNPAVTGQSALAAQRLIAAMLPSSASGRRETV